MFFIRLFLANTWKKFGDHCARLREKGEFISLSSFKFKGNLSRFVRARAHVHVQDDAKIVRSIDTQCNTKELP